MKNKKNKYSELLAFIMRIHNLNDYVKLHNPSCFSRYLETNVMLQISRKHILGDKINYKLYIKESLNDKINRRDNIKQIKELTSNGKRLILKL